jgi:hypothetical protein
MAYHLQILWASKAPQNLWIEITFRVKVWIETRQNFLDLVFNHFVLYLSWAQIKKSAMQPKNALWLAVLHKL